MTVDYEDKIALSVSGESSSGGPKRMAVDDNGLPVFSPYSIAGCVYAEVGDGRKIVTAAGTRETLTAASTPAKYVIVTALDTNTNRVTVGGNTVLAALVTGKGVSLLPRQKAGIWVDDLLDVYVDARVSGEGVSYTYFS